MIWLRKKKPALLEGTYQAETEAPKDCYVFTRSIPEQKLLICLNFSRKARTISLPAELRPLFSTHNLRNKKPTESLTLAPLEGCLLEY
jgi:glycosidase